jgi:hypothetical protein
MTRFIKPREHPRRPRPPIRLTLSDAELKIVIGAASDLDIEKRTLFLQRLAAQLSIRSVSVEAAVQRALTGLQHR